jgi:hypothetical protein
MTKVTTRKAGTKHRYHDTAIDPLTGEPGYLKPWRLWRADPANHPEPSHDEIELVEISVDGEPVAVVPVDDVDAYRATYGL